MTIEGDPVAYMCEVRIMPGSGLAVGNYVWVEFGAFWTEVEGEKIRHKGQWRRCLVLPSASATSAEVHVRLDPLRVV